MKKNIEDEILSLLSYHAPNFISETTILSRLSKYPQELVTEKLKLLTENETLELTDDSRPVSGAPEKFYRLKTTPSFVRRTIRIGDFEVPRLLSDSKARLLPGILNEQIERVAEYSLELEKRFSDLVKNEQRRYWANLVGVMGVIVAILAVIIVGLPKITTDPMLPFWDVVFLNLAQLLPLVIVLGLLVLILRWVVR